MKFLPLIVSLFLLVGCGGGGGSGGGSQDNTSNLSPNKEDNNDTSSKQTADFQTIKDPYFQAQWYLHKNDRFYTIYGIDSNTHVHGEKHYARYTGKGVKIAIIDDGLDVNHPDLEGSIKETYSLITEGKNVAPHETNSHGTFVTGLIAANKNNRDIFGLANESEIMFLQYTNWINDDEVITLFQKASEFGADIINNSWGTGDASDTVRDAITKLANTGRNGKGTLIVFASGNGTVINNETVGINILGDESDIPAVIAVGATGRNNTVTKYSNYGVNLDLVAPGGDDEVFMLSLKAYDYNSYGAQSGTSFSAPLVSGALAMLLEANPNLTRVQVKKLLQTSSDKIGKRPYDKNGHNMHYGYGKLNINKLIDAGLNAKQ